MITIHVLTYNEEIILPYFIKHYQQRFAGCKFIIYDNYSTDSTQQIAEANQCKIIQFDSNNEINEDIYLSIKNHCWKESETDWNIVCDADEFLDMNINDLEYENSINTNIIKSTAWHMVNMDKAFTTLHTISYGIRDMQYDKCLLFNKKYISDINYDPGCHKCKPKYMNLLKFNSKTYNLYHMVYLSEDMVIQKYKRNKSRLSNRNIRRNWGIQYHKNEEEIIAMFNQYRSEAQKIR